MGMFRVCKCFFLHLQKIIYFHNYYLLIFKENNMTIRAKFDSFDRRLSAFTHSLPDNLSDQDKKRYYVDFKKLCEEFRSLKRDYKDSEFLGYVSSLQNKLSDLGQIFPEFKKDDLHVRGKFLLSNSKILYLSDLIIESGSLTLGYYYSVPVAIAVGGGWGIIRFISSCFR